MPIKSGVKTPFREKVTADTQGLHSMVVRVAVVSAWIITLTLAGVALVIGDDRLLLESLAPATAAVLFTLQLVFRRENAVVTLGVGVVIVVATFPLVGTEDTALGAALAIVSMATISSLFVERRRNLFLTVVAAGMMAVPVLWTREVRGALAAGLIMAVSFLIGAAAFTLIRGQAVAVDQRFRLLFERAPVALIEQDWSKAMERTRRLKANGPDDLRKLLESDVAVIKDIVSLVKIVGANDASSTLLGIPRDQLLGLLPPDRVNGSSRSMWLEAIIEMWSGTAPTNSEYQTTDFRGRPGLWLDVKTIGLGPDTGPRVVLAITDVSRSRQRSESLAELVKAKDEFIATVSHELRTPLTAVVGLANEVLNAQDLTPQQRGELLEVVVAQANEISYLVEDLLIGARTEIGTVTVSREKVDLTAETESVLDPLDGGFTVEAAGSVPPAVADPVRVRQIVRNLAVNAERYGGPSRRVVVTATAEKVAVEVRDNGLPLSDDDAARVFEPYTRAHNSPGVTMSVGLGLAVSRQLARLMQGDLTYHHDGAEGVFRLTLPTADETATAPAISAPR